MLIIDRYGSTFDISYRSFKTRNWIDSGSWVVLRNPDVVAMVAMVACTLVARQIDLEGNRNWNHACNDVQLLL